MNIQCDEVWKQTKYELYEVSNKGSVRNKKSNKILKVEVKGYTSKVNITINNKTKKVSIKELVADSFCIEGDGENIWHKDHDYLNNSSDNLYYTKHHPKTLGYIATILNKKFNRLEFLEFIGNKRNGVSFGIFKCECSVQKILEISSVVNGYTKSCGCLQKEQTSLHHEQYKINGKQRKDSPEVKAYKSMIDRVYRSNQEKAIRNYQQRGIKVCDEWLGFGDYELGLKNFISDMGEKPSEEYELDRIDVNGNYCKENCRWVDRRINQFNKRISDKNTSGKTGVCWHKQLGKWRAYITANGSHKALGVYDNFEDAVKAREEAEIEYYGFTKE